MSTNTNCRVQEVQAKQIESQPTHPITVVSGSSFKSKDNTDAESRIDNDVRTTTDSIRRKPSNFLIPSMLVALLCFWPLGFAAIWQAIKSRRAAKIGEYESAKTHSSMAKSFIAFSIALGILQAIVMVTVVMLQLYVFPRYVYSPVDAVATRVHQ